MPNSHTPGPWSVSALDPNLVCRLDDVPEIPRAKGIARALARTGETEANARLIAASPALLTALQQIKVATQREDGRREQALRDIYGIALAAIARAEGREPTDAR